MNFLKKISIIISSVMLLNKICKAAKFNENKEKILSITNSVDNPLIKNMTDEKVRENFFKKNKLPLLIFGSILGASAFLFKFRKNEEHNEEYNEIHSFLSENIIENFEKDNYYIDFCNLINSKIIEIKKSEKYDSFWFEKILEYNGDSKNFEKINKEIEEFSGLNKDDVSEKLKELNFDIKNIENIKDICADVERCGVFLDFFNNGSGSYKSLFYQLFYYSAIDGIYYHQGFDRIMYFLCYKILGNKTTKDVQTVEKSKIYYLYKSIIKIFKELNFLNMDLMYSYYNKIDDFIFKNLNLNVKNIYFAFDVYRSLLIDNIGFERMIKVFDFMFAFWDIENFKSNMDLFIYYFGVVFFKHINKKGKINDLSFISSAKCNNGLELSDYKFNKFLMGTFYKMHKKGLIKL